MSTLLEQLPKKRNIIFNPEPTVMDELTYQLVEMPDLLKAMDTSVTSSGSLSLKRSFRQPLTSASEIRSKQEAVKELSFDDKLRAKVESYLKEAAEHEDEFYSYFYGDYKLGYSDQPNLYEAFKGTRDFLKHSVDVDGLNPHSKYLRSRVSSLKRLGDSNDYDWVKQEIFGTPLGLRLEDNTPWYLPKFTFYPRDLKPHFYIGATGALGSILFMTALAGSSLALLSGASNLPIISRAGETAGELMQTTVPMLLLVSALRGFHRIADDDLFIKPMAKRYFRSQAISQAVDDLGRIDEILTLVKYGESLKGLSTIPEIIDSPYHQFMVKGLSNPRMVLDDPNYVPNDIDLDEERLTFLTGPNSGGKTSTCKSIAQAQILAQIGSAIPGKEARVSVADRVFYQAPMINSLRDSEGRLGTEGSGVRDIFFQTTPQSLVMLDELIEATTYEERLMHSAEILKDFARIGNSTILVTHNHQLAEDFRKRKLGRFWQVEFSGSTSTHKLLPGISTESHSDEVMERIGFTKERRQEHLDKLRAQGYSLPTMLY